MPPQWPMMGMPQQMMGGMPMMGMPQQMVGGMPMMGMQQQEVNIAPAQFQPFMMQPSPLLQTEHIDLLLDVPLEVTVELGRTSKSIKEILPAQIPRKIKRIKLHQFAVNQRANLHAERHLHKFPFQEFCNIRAI